MAAPIILISSSPPSNQGPALLTSPSTQGSQHSVPIRAKTPSSPSLPSPSELLKRIERPSTASHRLKSGSRALPVPEGAITGFASAGRLLRDNVLELGNEAETIDMQDAPLPKRKPRAKRSKSINVGQDAGFDSGAGKGENDITSEATTANPRGVKDQVLEEQRTESHTFRTGISGLGILEKAPASTLGVTGMREAAERIDDAAAKLSRMNAALCDAPAVSTLSEGIGRQDSALAGDSSNSNTVLKPKAKRARAWHRRSREIVAVQKAKSRQSSTKKAEKVTSKLPMKKVKKTGKQSHHFGGSVGVTTEAIQKATESPQALDLDIAQTRRRDWTPTKDTARPPCSPPESTTVDVNPDGGSVAKLDLTSFAYAHGDGPNGGCAPGLVDGPTKTKKRKLSSPDKPALDARTGASVALQSKALKRPKSITERVIAPFRQNIASNDTMAATGVNDMAASLPGDIISRSDVTSGFKPPPQLGKGRRSSKKAPKSEPVEAKLLSPEAFERSLERQDILFATASQLVTESPTYLRQYQQAIKESELEAAAHGHRDVTASRITSKQMTTLADGGSLADTLAHSDLAGCLPAIPRPIGGLWSANARYTDDEVWAPTQRRFQSSSATTGPPSSAPLDDAAQGATTVEGPPPDPECKTIQDLQLAQTTGSKATDRCPQADDRPVDDSYLDISELVPRSQESPSSAFPTLEPPALKQPDATNVTTDAFPSALQTSLASRTASSRLRDRMQARSALEPLDANALLKQRASPASKSNVRAMHTTAKPADDNAKPTTDAAKPPADEAKSSNDIAKPSDATAAEIEVATVAKRPRGRPRKDASAAAISTKPAKQAKRPKTTPKAPAKRSKSKAKVPSSTTSKSYIHIDEIEDSEPEISPSPPRRKKKAQISALELVSSQGEVIEEFEEPPEKRDAKTQFEKQKDEVYAKITKIVKNTPRTTVPSKPSWHEKILLYDPIVLEDFTEWLNSQGATYTKPCFGKKAQALRDEQKGKDDDGDAPDNGIVGTPLPLEAWMTQKWCEANSVCCLWREGLRGGVKARY